MLLQSRMKSRGFTLLEVLVAGVILFAVVATTSMIFNNAILSKTKASQSLSLYGYLPVIVEHVTEQIKMGVMQGKAVFDVLQYDWSAKKIATKKIVEHGSSINESTSSRSAFLFEVTLKLNVGSVEHRKVFFVNAAEALK
ncbi:MAG: type II secretion system protein J [Aestuariibacter sp.]